jgi:hypothetical protein
MGLLGNSTDLLERNKDHTQGSNTDCKQDNGIHIQPAAGRVYKMALLADAVLAVQSER